MPVLTLCRFDAAGRLHHGSVDIEKVPFIAISHVWGYSEWRKIPNIPAEVLCTEHKARFIREKLPLLVGGNWFWMDILCVDQAKKENRIGVVKYIPDIYRTAFKTIAIREGGGLGPCCARLLHSFLNIKEDPSWYPRNDENGVRYVHELATEDHIDELHSNLFKEAWMERVWTLQELELSDTIQFAVCEQIMESEPTHRKRIGASKIKMVLQDVRDAAKIWAGAGRWLWTDREDYVNALEAHERLEHEFLEALLHNGIVKRERDTSHQEVFSVTCFDVLSQSVTSIRETSKARDFILAIFPRYPWYKIPDNVLSMDFHDLFQDCIYQIKTLYASIPGMRPRDADETAPFVRLQDVLPKITDGLVLGMNMPAETSGEPFYDVPMPKTLGDFCKLLYHYSDPKPKSPPLPSGTFWKIHDISSDDTIDTILQAASSTMWFSRFQTHVNFLQELLLWKEDTDGLEAVNMLTRMDFLDDDLANPNIQALMHRFGDIILGQHHEKVDMLGPPGIHEVILEIGGVILSTRRGLPQLTDVLARSQSTGQQPDGKIGLSFEPAWQELRRRVFDNDSPAFRQAILHLVTHTSCGLGISALPWTRNRLRPYLLVVHDSKGPVTDPKLAQQTLFFAAPDLDYDFEDDVIAYDGMTEPYVMTVSKRRGDGQARVIGLLSERDGYRPQGFDVTLNWGCPYMTLWDDE